MAVDFRLILSAVIFFAALGVGAVAAQEPETRTVEQYSCKDIMREHGTDRDVAIAFLHGFLLGKSGASTFKLDVLHKQTADFIERCLDSPGEKAVDVMSKIKG
ncbi:MAG TPA: HdeA/HdeB family chaperone [Pseudolabrys sp.]|nr:HdeA/HdeB family chaperone [Pseudolabrys sp.]